LISWRDALRIALVLLVGGLLALAWLEQRSGASQPKPPVTDRPTQVLEDGYVSSQACVACHPEMHASWHASYHRTMTQVATPKTVHGDFANTELELDGHRYRLQQRGDEFWVEDTHAGYTTNNRVELVTGSHHMQVFWYGTGLSRTLGQFPFFYLLQEQQWVPRDAAFVAPPSEHQTGTDGRWHKVCIRCHTTQGRPRKKGLLAADSRVAEFGIACEACHGPAEEHIRLNRNPLRRYALHWTDQPDPSIVNPARLSSHLSTQVCGHCHSYSLLENAQARRRYNSEGFQFRPGDELEESGRILVRFDPEEDLKGPPDIRRTFWDDGMVRVSGREYNGLLETPCFQRGDLSCLSCHTLHKSPDDPRSLRSWANDQLSAGMEGNGACLQCHEAARFDTPAHSHHSPGSSGSQCYNCHMPHTTYGLLKAMRSHTVDSPSVASSVEVGRPNACNLCHLDKSLQWTADQLQAWYGIPSPDLSTDQQDLAASLLWLIGGDAGQRALLAWSMGWNSARETSGTDWMGIHLAQLLDDPYPAVRFIAYRSLRDLEGFEQLSYDYVASREERTLTQREAEQMWRNRPAAGRPQARNQTRDQAHNQTGAPILIAPDGSVLQTEVDRLRAQRDDRPLILLE